MAVVITLLVAGVLLVLAESVLPGMIAGVVGLCCLFAGVLEGYIRFGEKWGNLILLTLLLMLVAGFALWLKFFPDSRIARIFVSRGVSGETGTEKPGLVRQKGTTLTRLRPSGTAVIDGHRVDVVTEGEWIDNGAAVEVVSVEGMRVVVRQI
jgi:membrane-bound serine protease (ClpP class)